MAIDHPRDDDHASGIDNDRIPALRRAGEIGSDGGDSLALDQDITGGKVANADVHGDNDSAADQDAAAAVVSGAPQSVERGLGTGASLG